MARVSVHIVTWNSMKVLPGALESLRAQSFTDFTLTVVDNASTDGTVDCVRELFPQATVLRNFNNLGFSRAHNQAVILARKAGARYVLVMNPDIILTPDFLQELVLGVEHRTWIGSATGKLLRVRHPSSEGGEPEFTDVIDSAGLVMRRHLRAADRGSGETDRGQYAKPEEVFGVSGALALYRIEALGDAEASSGEIFDETFFAYSEDVDLAWRLRLLGWKSAFVPQAVAYHYRSIAGAEKRGLWQALLERRRRPAMINRLATRNHLLMIAKNEDWSSGLRHAPFILAYETAKFLEALLVSQRTLPAYLDALLKFPAMLRKRRRLMRARKTLAKDVRKWFR